MWRIQYYAIKFDEFLEEKGPVILPICQVLCLLVMAAIGGYLFYGYVLSLSPELQKSILGMLCGAVATMMSAWKLTEISRPYRDSMGIWSLLGFFLGILGMGIPLGQTPAWEHGFWVVPPVVFVVIMVMRWLHRL